MSRSTPSLVALLGLVAVAGYQNRSRISDMLSDAQQRTNPDGTTTPSTGNGFIAEIGQFFQGGMAENSVSSAIGDLVERFRSVGNTGAADSWVSAEANRPLDVKELEMALGDETLDELAQKTGLTRAELLLRLNTALPDVVDRLTPDGRLPGHTDLQSDTPVFR